MAARLAAGFFAAFAAFQIALAFGAPFGRMVWGGGPAVLTGPMRWASGGAAAYLLAAGAVMLVRSKDLRTAWPKAPFRWFNGLLALQMALNTAANLASSTPAERYGMGSASALGCLLCLVALAAPTR
jgi:hypothetical protein